MVKGVTLGCKQERFAPTPWTKESAEWQALNKSLPVDHAARHVDRAMEMLDLDPLIDSYLGVGKKALRPDLLLKMVLYEMQNNRPSPAVEGGSKRRRRGSVGAVEIGGAHWCISEKWQDGGVSPYLVQLRREAQKCDPTWSFGKRFVGRC